MVRGLDLQVAEELAQDVLMTTYQHARCPAAEGVFFRLAVPSRGKPSPAIPAAAQTENRNHQPDAEFGSRVETQLRERDRAGRTDFQRWMDLLEPVERQIMMLRYSEELGYQEIANALHSAGNREMENLLR